jgi:hypothetical protein
VVGDYRSDNIIMPKQSLLICIFTVILFFDCFAKSVQIIDTNNEFGGKTQLISAEHLPKLAMEKTYAYLDQSGELVKGDIYYKKQYWEKLGYKRKIGFYKNKRKTKEVNYYSDYQQINTGFTHQVIWYDITKSISPLVDGTIREEFFCTPDFSVKNGVHKIVYYDDLEEIHFTAIKTKELNYFKQINTYYPNKDLKSKEMYLIASLVKTKGFNRKKFFYDGQGRKTKSEWIYPKNSPQGINKIVNYYFQEGTVSKAELFVAKAMIVEAGFYKRVISFNKQQNEVNKEYFDEFGKKLDIIEQ